MTLRSPGRRGGACVLVAVALTVSSPARAGAQSYPPALVTRARVHFRTGVAAAHAGDWPTALGAFSEAYALVPQPQTLFNLAAAQEATQRLVAASQSYARFLREAATTPALASRRAAAQRVMRDLARRIPRLRVACETDPATDQLALDGQPLAAAAMATELPVDPGAHVVTATRGGLEVARAPFAAVEGELRVVTLALPSPVRPRIAAPVVVHTAEPARVRWLTVTPPSRPRPSPVIASPWLWLTVGVVVVGGTAAGLAAGGVFSPTAHGTLPPVDVH